MLSRRGFIVSGIAASGGLLVAYGLRQLDDGDAALRFAESGQSGAPLNAWLKISPDGEIVCAIHRAELGQGVTTSLPMLLAEELDADWSKVRFEFAGIDRDYYNFGMLLRGQPLGDPEASLLAGTGTWAIRQVFHAMGMAMTISSSSMVDAWDTLRPAGAAARQMLLQAAAKKWGVAADSLRTENGWVIDPQEQRKLSYGELAETAAQLKPPGKVAIKDRANYRIVGTDVPRLDTFAKVTGTAQFGIDVTLPDMLHATVVHSPVCGTRVADFDSAEAEAMPGVRKVLLAGEPGRERAVAVIADSTWEAMQAARAITITPLMNGVTAMDTRDFEPRYSTQLDNDILISSEDEGSVVLAGDETIDAVLNNNPATISAEYSVPFLAHACMEPMNCTALYSGDALELWSPSQANSFARDVAANIAGLEPEQVTVHTTFMGGGFGRRADMDYVKEVVSIALAMPGRPVKLTWSREEDIRHGTFRPAAFGRLRGALSNDGRLQSLDFNLATQSVVASYEERTPTPRGGTARTDGSVATAATELFYPHDHLRVRYSPIETHVPAGYWRSVSHSWCTFFIESFIDELAHSAGENGYTVRQRLLENQPRMLAVLDTAAQQANWDQPLPANHGRGIALAQSHDTIVAHIVEVSTEAGVFSRVTRVVTAVDCGFAVHPDNVRAQMESSVTDGLSAAIYGEISIVAGVPQQGNYDTYKRLRIDEIPVIDIHIVPSDLRPGGVGEPAVPGVAPALSNAIFNATGQRIRTLPIRSGS